MIRDVGDGVALRYESRTPAGTLTNATILLTVTAPDGTTSTPTVTATATGIYDATVVPTAAGVWTWRWNASGAVTDVATGQFTAADPAPPSYTSLAALKLAVKIADVDRDELLIQNLAAASRGIDRHCGRRFWLDTTATARTYTPRGRIVCTDDGELLLVDDIGSTLGMTVEVGSGTTWTAVPAADYELQPDNGIVRGEPITGLLRTLALWVTHPRQRVRVTARWGWPRIPDEVAQATLIQAGRLYKRKDSPEGVAGNAEWGIVRLARVDPDVEALTRHLVQQPIG